MRSSRAVQHPLGGVALSVDGVGSLQLEGYSLLDICYSYGTRFRSSSRGFC